VGHLGRQGTSIYSPLAQTTGLRTTPFLRVKNSTDQMATIKIHALKGLDAICGGKNRTLLSTPTVSDHDVIYSHRRTKKGFILVEKVIKSFKKLIFLLFSR
jgi:hypothetical protein